MHESLTADWFVTNKCQVHLNKVNAVFQCNMRDIYVLPRSTPFNSQDWKLENIYKPWELAGFYDDSDGLDGEIV